MKYYYAYELKIASVLELSCFRPYEGGEKPDVTIEFGQTPEELAEDGTQTVERRVRFEMSKGKILYHLLDGTRAYITNGDLITIEPSAKPDWEFVSLHIRTRMMAGILHQRHYMPLHSSAIEVDGKAVMFVGRSGAGKSTLTGAFIKKGYSYLADDWGVLRKTDAGDYHLLPSYPQLRFWQNTLDLLGTDDSLIKGSPIRPGLEKYYISTRTKMAANPIPVRTIYLLKSHVKPSVDILPVDKFRALMFLMKHTFAKLQLEGMGGYQEQFNAITYLLNTTEIKLLYRQEYLDKPAFWEMVDKVEQDFLKRP